MTRLRDMKKVHAKVLTVFLGGENLKKIMNSENKVSTWNTFSLVALIVLVCFPFSYLSANEGKHA